MRFSLWQGAGHDELTPLAPWEPPHGAGETSLVVARSQRRTRRRSCALTATITVLADMRIAPTAGESTIP